MLKKIGRRLLWILLGIILFPIALLLLIIFLVMCIGRVRYRVDARIGGEKNTHIEVSYFRRLLRVVYTYAKGKGDTDIRLAGIRLGGKSKDKAKKNKKGKKDKKDKRDKHGEENNSQNDNKGENESKVKHEPKKERENKNNHVSKAANPIDNLSASARALVDKLDEDEKMTEKTNKAKTKDTKIDNAHASENETEKEAEKETKDEKKDPFAIINRIKAALTYPDRKIIMSLTMQSLQKLCRALKPRIFDISGIIGFDDPATTGWFMGAYEAITSLFGIRPHIKLWGSYHEKALDLDIEIEGRASLGRLVWPFFWLYLKRPIRKLIHKHLL